MSSLVSARLPGTKAQHESKPGYFLLEDAKFPVCIQAQPKVVARL